MDDHIRDHIVPHLRNQFSRAWPILFTGAGFSCEALNIHGKNLPGVDVLKRALWEISFGSEPVEDTSSLQDVFEAAMLSAKNRLIDFLTEEFTVDATSLPAWYGDVFSLAWYRCYTLNIDNLETATARNQELPRRIRSVSAIKPEDRVTNALSGELIVCHLNGCLEDIPNHVTFSRTQYAERLAQQDPWYVHFASELLTHPVVFIGTTLDEPPLWQHLELRRGRGGQGLQELRPRSYLVTPHLDAARRLRLRQYNVEWIKMTAEQFSREVLSQVLRESDQGLQLVSSRRRDSGSMTEIPHVSEISQATGQKNEFLLGAEPVWGDLQENRAIEREIDHKVWDTASRLHSEVGARVLLITGTAGSGKSTSLMRIVLRLAAGGVNMRWIDKSTDISPYAIRSACSLSDDNDSIVLAIDDADIYGRELSSLVKELAELPKVSLIILAIRSGRVDFALNPSLLRGVDLSERSMPHLSNSDIDALIDVLKRENRLGVLQGLNLAKQRQAFKNEAGRQLLVAMIQATSGVKFEEKAYEEFCELDAISQRVYGLVAVASSLRFYLLRNEIMIATGDLSNEALNALNTLIQRNVIALEPTKEDAIRARHRVIGNIVRDRLTESGQLGEVISGLAYIAATQMTPSMPRNSRPKRLLTRLLNHASLERDLGLEGAREVYESIEGILNWDFHFWLQRGSLEVKSGRLDLAENFLNQARGLAPDDPFVETEFAYLQFRLARNNPLRQDAQNLIKEAVINLTDAIRQRGNRDSYPYHVLGTQGLSWSRYGITNVDEKRAFLQQFLQHVEEGEKFHPHDLGKIKNDLQAELLLLATDC